jgi:hypothetical protein
MRITARDLWSLEGVGREVFVGVGVACLVGLGAGAMVKPTAQDMRQVPPPMEASDRSQDAASTAPDNVYAGYHGRLPDYVLGTDWTHPKPILTPQTDVALPQPIDTVDDAAVDASDDAPARDDPPSERHAHAYPSEGGDMLAGRSSDAEAQPD